MHSDRLLSRLQRLVAFDTQNPPGSREAGCAAYVAEELKSMGFAVAVDAFEGGRANVIATLGNGNGPVFAFNTHMDVVPAGEGWSSDPFTLSARGDRLHGRGSCDAKGSLAAMLEACEHLAASREAWTGVLMAVFVADEEASSRGAKRYAATRPQIDYVVVGEPSGNVPIIAHKGSLRPLVRVAGRTAHSGTPDLGLNAIYEAGRLLPWIGRAHAALRARIHPLVGSPSLTVTRVMGGIADNVVPAACDLLLDRRLIPGESEASALAEIESMLANAQREDGIESHIVECRPTTGGAAETPTGHKTVAAAIAAARANGIADPTPIGFQGACDFVHFRDAGAQGVVLGPGDLAVAHKPDEFVPRAELEAAVLIYRDMALSLLARP